MMLNFCLLTTLYIKYLFLLSYVVANIFSMKANFSLGFCWFYYTEFLCIYNFFFYVKKNFLLLRNPSLTPRSWWYSSKFYNDCYTTHGGSLIIDLCIWYERNFNLILYLSIIESIKQCSNFFQRCTGLGRAGNSAQSSSPGSAFPNLTVGCPSSVKQENLSLKFTWGWGEGLHLLGIREGAFQKMAFRLKSASWRKQFLPAPGKWMVLLF